LSLQDDSKLRKKHSFVTEPSLAYVVQVGKTS